jgi:hypothetical protein
MNSIFGVKLIASEHHVSHSYLNSMRKEGDILADDVVSYLFEKHGISNINRNFDKITDDFIDSLLSNSLKDNKYLTEPINLFQTQILTIPNWVDWKLVNKGQNLFLKHLSASSLGLLYFSLLGGFSAPKIVSVLDETGYLTKARDLTWRRLLETMQMVVSCVDINDNTMKPGNSGWKSVIKVRLLHARVRNNVKINNKFDVEENGIPINQEDMMGTLLSFSINIIETIEKVSGKLSLDEKNAYIHLWRYIGYIIGCKDEYNPLTDLNIARGRLESISGHILSPTERSKQVVTHVLLSVANRDMAINTWDFQYHSQCKFNHIIS